MALSKELMELVGFIKDEKARGESIALLDKTPEFQKALQDGVLRQSDYSRVVAEARTAKEKADAKVAEWTEWYEKENPKFEKLSADLETERTKNTELAKQLEAAASRGDANVDEKTLMENVDKRIAEKGYLTNADVVKMVKEEADKLAADKEKLFVGTTIPAAMQFTRGLIKAGIKFEKEFGKELDEKTFATFISERKIESMDEAYKSFTEDMRHTKELEAAKNQGIEQGRREASASHLPGSGAMPAPGDLGPVQLHIQGKKGADSVPDNAVIGTGALASAAAAALRQEGKF